MLSQVSPVPLSRVAQLLHRQGSRDVSEVSAPEDVHKLYFLGRVPAHSLATGANRVSVRAIEIAADGAPVLVDFAPE